MSLWTQRHIKEFQKRIPQIIRSNIKERRSYESLCFWIEITTGKIDGTWLATYLDLEMGFGHSILHTLFHFSIPIGREICCSEFNHFKQFMVWSVFPKCAPLEEYKRSLLSRGHSNFGEFLALDIDKLAPKELAEWFLKVNFDYPLLDCHPNYQINLGVEDLLNGKENTDAQQICEILKRHLRGKQDEFSYRHKNTASIGLQFIELFD